MWEGLWDEFSGKLANVFEWLVTWLSNTITDVALALLLPIFEYIGEQMPDSWAPTIGNALLFLAFINSWVPIKFGFQMLGIFYAVKGFALGIKWVLKAIPGVW